MHRTTISMDDDDYCFVKEYGLEVSEIVRKHISEIRSMQDRNAAYVKELEGRIQGLIKHLNARIAFIEQKGLTNEFLAMEKHVPA